MILLTSNIFTTLKCAMRSWDRALVWNIHDLRSKIQPCKVTSMNLNFYNLKKFKMIKVALFASYLEIHVLTWSNPPIGNVFMKFDLIWPWLTKTFKIQRVDFLVIQLTFYQTLALLKLFDSKTLSYQRSKHNKISFCIFVSDA